MRVLAHVANTILLSGCVLLGGLGIGVVLLGSVIPALLWVGVALVGLGFGPVFPTALAVGAQTAPGHAGMASSLVIASGSVGAMVLPWASGALIPRLGPVGSMAGLIVPLAVMLGCLLFMLKNR